MIKSFFKVMKQITLMPSMNPFLQPKKQLFLWHLYNLFYHCNLCSLATCNIIFVFKKMGPELPLQKNCLAHLTPHTSGVLQQDKIMFGLGRKQHCVPQTGFKDNKKANNMTRARMTTGLKIKNIVQYQLYYVMLSVPTTTPSFY